MYVLCDSSLFQSTGKLKYLFNKYRIMVKTKSLCFILHKKLLFNEKYVWLCKGIFCIFIFSRTQLWPSWGQMSQAVFTTFLQEVCLGASMRGGSWCLTIMASFVIVLLAHCQVKRWDRDFWVSKAMALTDFYSGFFEYPLMKQNLKL